MFCLFVCLFVCFFTDFQNSIRSFSFSLLYQDEFFSLQLYTKVQTTVLYKPYDRVAGEDAIAPHNYA